MFVFLILTARQLKCNYTVFFLTNFTSVQGLLGWYMVKSGLDHKNFEGKWMNFCYIKKILLTMRSYEEVPFVVLISS